MFYKLIAHKRDEWLASSDCAIRELLMYIERKGKMRDAQIDAIKTYLFLKIECANRPLWRLFVDGVFNTLNLSDLALTETAREVLRKNKAAAALLEYAMLTDRKGNQLAQALETFIKEHADAIDYEQAFKKIFYDVSYTDYIFSLPMGAGKTYLMAAFIYLDLYFAQNEPDNPCFAHNFMVFAPSGLKSSIVPSLKHIKGFDPSWIIPEPTATQLKRLIKFEILDEQKSANKSNRTKNPNAQKINNYQPLGDLMGLVAITNAEKVILDRVYTGEASLFSEEVWNKVRQMHELRRIIGKLPNLAIYIDEVHHAADSDIKLRQVVEEWTKENTFNSVLGFSGTPYLDKAENVVLADTFSIKNTDLSNVVYYYPLIDGLGNFLKVPVVKTADSDTEMIVRNGIKNFLDTYKDTVYPDGTCAKVAVYCGQIETLEDTIYPLVAELVAMYGLEPTTTVLKYHQGKPQYPCPKSAATEFLSLDTSVSKVKVVLLVQIGKEGWDCKSLTGVILPHKKACPTNMVLQTSCRCLRQVAKNNQETAIIWMNKSNADILNKQLKQQQNITLHEFGNQSQRPLVAIERFSRMEHLQVPPIDFYQLKVSYQTLQIDEHTDVVVELNDEAILQEADLAVISELDFELNILQKDLEKREDTEYASYSDWLYRIRKESFNTLSVAELKKYDVELHNIFTKITVVRNGTRWFSHKYAHKQIRSLIRQAFVPKREFSVKEEIIPITANLLQIEKFVSPVYVDSGKETAFYPAQMEVKNIMEWDSKPVSEPLSPKVQAAIKLLEAQGMNTSALLSSKDPHPERAYTYHYLPYRFDSGFERRAFWTSILPIIRDKGLEIYFNGDDTLTEFKIDCYQQIDEQWSCIGKYVPDFLLIKRDDNGSIYKVVIIETKGEGFAAKFADRRRFVETEFVRKNNERFGYKRFDFLYIEDSESITTQEKKIFAAIDQFIND